MVCPDKVLYVLVSKGRSIQTMLMIMLWIEWHKVMLLVMNLGLSELRLIQDGCVIDDQ